MFISAATIVYGIVKPQPTAVSAAILLMGELMLVWSGFTIYYMLRFVVLPLRLSRCQFKLHIEDPVSTEVLAHWSGMMNCAAYMFAFMLAAGTLWSVTMMPFTLGSLMFTIPIWLPLIALFVVNQMAMSQVIGRSKRKSLSDVKAQMATLRPTGYPPDHESMETLLWLWDYHDRIKGTRNSVLDIKGIMNLVNTLLIPVLANLIANREPILEAVTEPNGWAP